MSKIRKALRQFVLDPVVRKIESRIEHFRSLKPITHDGECWARIADIGNNALFYPEARLQNRASRDRLHIGANCHIRGEIAVMPNGHFTIGAHSFIGPSSRIWSQRSIAIGNHVLISHLVDIHDSDSHSLSWWLRREESIDLFEFGRDIDRVDVRRAPVDIKDDVWIGLKSTVLAGVTIGRGAVVAAGSVVTRDVEEFTLVAGNPARAVRDLPRTL